MQEKNFLSFKTFERFERDIMYDVSASNLESKIERSEAFKIITKKDKSILTAISDFFNSDSLLDTLAHFYVVDLESAWVILLDKIAVVNSIDVRPSISDVFKAWKDWLKNQK